MRTVVALLTLLTALSAPAQAPPAQPSWEIPVTAQEPGCPSAGWCGEASIQMTCMYYGCYFPQKLINTLGHPTHPDLWSNELGPSLNALGFTCGSVGGDCDHFISALKPILASGTPVILGVNVYSKNHGDAHFCVAAKCDDTNLTINTTWAMTPNVFTWDQLHKKSGITLADVFMGIVVPAPPALKSHRLRLYPESAKEFFGKTCKMRIEAGNLKKSAAYMIQKFASVADATAGAKATAVCTFTADDTTYSREVEVDREQPAVFVLNRL